MKAGLPLMVTSCLLFALLAGSPKIVNSIVMLPLYTQLYTLGKSLGTKGTGQ